MNEWMNKNLSFTSNKIQTSNLQGKWYFLGKFVESHDISYIKDCEFQLFTRKYINGSWINENLIFFWGFQSKGIDFLKMPKDYWNLENIITTRFQ